MSRTARPTLRNLNIEIPAIIWLPEIVWDAKTGKVTKGKLHGGKRPKRKALPSKKGPRKK